MRIFHGLDEVKNIRNAVVTTGSFDGVHIGHKAILDSINQSASRIDGESVLITFHPHPRKVLYPESAGKGLQLINSQIEKIELLRNTGLDNLIIIPFTIEFSNISSLEFIRKILVGILHARLVVVGFNHHFGHNQEGDFQALYHLGKFHGFEVGEIQEQDIENETVSSTRIRKALLEGKIQRANAYLDHYYMIMGHIFPTTSAFTPLIDGSYFVEIEEECKLIPPQGVYAVTLHHKEKSVKALVLVRDEQHLKIRKKIEILPLEKLQTEGTVISKIYFHKMVRELNTIPERDALSETLEKDIEEIKDLIY